MDAFRWVAIGLNAVGFVAHAYMLVLNIQDDNRQDGQINMAFMAITALAMGMVAP